MAIYPESSCIYLGGENHPVHTAAGKSHPVHEATGKMKKKSIYKKK